MYADLIFFYFILQCHVTNVNQVNQCTDLHRDSSLKAPESPTTSEKDF